jgi:CRP-like cAMP-binding protein
MSQQPMVKLTASWDPVPAHERGDLGPLLDNVSGESSSPAIAWQLSSDGYDRALAIGPVALEPGALQDALDTFHHIRGSVATTMLVEPGSSDSVGVRVLAPHRVGHDVVAEIRRIAAGPLAPLLGPAVSAPLAVGEDGGGIAMKISARLIPEVVDTVVVTLAALGAAAVLETWPLNGPSSSGGAGGAAAGVDLLATARVLVNRLLPRGRAGLVEDLSPQLAARTPTDTERASTEPTATLPAQPPPPPAGEFGPLRIVDSRPGARPVNEARSPGSGGSKACGFVSSRPNGERDSVWVLFGLDEPAADGSGYDGPDSWRGAAVRLSASFIPGPHSPLTIPASVPALVDVPVAPRRVARGPSPYPTLGPARFVPGQPGFFVAEIDPLRDLFPGSEEAGWSWDTLDPAMRAVTPDGEDPFTFAHLFFQRLRVELALLDGDGSRRALRSTEVEVFDVDRIGSLYERLITQLVAVDSRAQAAARGARRVYEAYHPWYPVLAIGLAKARLYMRAVLEDIALQRHNLTDPGWLMRVGLHLEFLTCLGIVEAVRPEYPDLLSSAERHCWEQSPAFAESRRRVDPARWREVWAMRSIVFAGTPLTAAGPVDFRNLLKKQTAVLAFLEVHHADLKNAIALAGPAPGGGQHTWHRVFRDAERAVLGSSQTAFPELRHLRGSYQNMVLWHERGTLPVTPSTALPEWLSAAIGDRDGAYPTAARRYRESMNEVAAWAKGRGLMDYYGTECIPPSASLIEARLVADDDRYAALQAEDGFGPPPDRTRYRLADANAALGRDADPGEGEALDGANGGTADEAAAEIVAAILRATEIFQPLTSAEILQLAHNAKRRTYVAGDEIIHEGQPSVGLHLIERGSVEVRVVQADDTELTVDRMAAGDLFGEYSLLTGRPTSATVRARDTALVHVIPPSALAPIIANRPEIVVELSVLLADRRANRRSRSEDYLYADTDTRGTGVVERLAGRMRAFLLS